jgi:hypothetical protein
MEDYHQSWMPRGRGFDGGNLKSRKRFKGLQPHPVQQQKLY